MSRQPSSSPDRKDPSTGSPSSGEPVYLAIGKLRRPHGVHGEIQMEVLTDFPERLRAGAEVYVGQDHRPLKIAAVRSHDQLLLMAFDGFSTPEEVGIFRNQILYVRSDQLPFLPEGEYYHHQLIGLRVVDEENRLLGQVKEILETGANDVYVVRPETGSEILLPAIADVILAVDLQKGEIKVRPPRWE